jgi:trans-aconitate methyltransferase
MNSNSDNWNAAATYDGFMGRWSRELAPKFVARLAPAAQQHWLEVGCGTGSLTRAICAFADPASVIACDPSAEFVEYAKSSVQHRDVTFITASADDFPMREGGYDIITSLLALNFFPSAPRALQRMCSATRSGGIVSACVWDYAGEMQFLRYFWESAKRFDTTGQHVDEGERFPLCNPEALTQLFTGAGLDDVECEALDIVTTFRDFTDYWTPFLGGTGPAPSFLASLSESQREQLRGDLQRAVPTSSSGNITMVARAWAIRGRPTRMRDS